MSEQQGTTAGSDSEAWEDDAPAGSYPRVKSVSFVTKRPSINGQLIWDQINVEFDFGDAIATEAGLKAAFGRLKFERLAHYRDVVGVHSKADVESQSAWLMVSCKNPNAPAEVAECGPNVRIHKLSSDPD